MCPIKFLIYHDLNWNGTGKKIKRGKREGKKINPTNLISHTHRKKKSSLNNISHIVILRLTSECHESYIKG